MLYHATVLAKNNEICFRTFDVVLLDEILAIFNEMYPCGLRYLAVKEPDAKDGFIYSIENGELKAMDKWEMLFLEETLMKHRLRLALYQINNLFERYTMPSESLQSVVSNLNKELGTYFASLRDKKDYGGSNAH